MLVAKGPSAAWPGLSEDDGDKRVSHLRAVFFKLWVVKSIRSVTKINF